MPRTDRYKADCAAVPLSAGGARACQGGLSILPRGVLGGGVGVLEGWGLCPPCLVLHTACVCLCVRALVCAFV